MEIYHKQEAAILIFDPSMLLFEMETALFGADIVDRLFKMYHDNPFSTVTTYADMLLLVMDTSLDVAVIDVSIDNIFQKSPKPNVTSETAMVLSDMQRVLWSMSKVSDVCMWAVNQFQLAPTVTFTTDMPLSETLRELELTNIECRLT